MTDKSSYGQVLKASSIMGGAAGMTLLLSMLRVKFAAVFIGTTGVGLNASYTALQGLIGTLAGLGIQSSAVRDIAAAVASGDENAIGRKVLTLRRVCWLTGLAGMSSTMLLSPLISQLTFGHRDHAVDIAALGLIILLTNLSGGQMALIQGMRRIGDIARANIAGAAVGTVAAIGFYAGLGLRGVVPALLVAALAQLAFSWRLARRLPVPRVKLTLRQTCAEAGSMVRLGLVMMWNGLMGSAVAYITVLLITKLEGVQAVGLYSAAFALSGMFVNFVLSAMGADYYPRLTAATNDKTAMNRMVNEQTEIGLLLAVPGLLATMTLAPWILQLFYTNEFLGATVLLQWFILGCLGRVISWPMGFVMIALGKSKYLIASETFFHAIHILFVLAGLKLLGLTGVACAFALTCAIHVLVTLFAAKRLLNFSWTPRAKITIVLCSAASVLLLILSMHFDPIPAALVGITATLLSLANSVRLILQKNEAYRRLPLLEKAYRILRWS